jgi:probable rRNA maturation factor
MKLKKNKFLYSVNKNAHDLVYSKNTKKFLSNVTKVLSKTHGPKDVSLFEVSFVNDKEIKEINNKYRNINEPTDVISFALNDSKGHKSNMLGEIFISADTAKRDAKEKGVELSLYVNELVLHGLLHLLGYDHASPTQEKIMFTIQDFLLRAYGTK